MEFKLQQFLEKRNITQKKMSDDLSLSTSLVNQYVKKKCYPDYNMLCKIADYLHITTDELLGRPTTLINTNNWSPIEQSIIQKILSMNNTQQELTEFYIDTLLKSTM